MKVLKGLVLTMLVSTATIFSMDVSSFGDLLTTDVLKSSQTVAQTTEVGTVGDSLLIGESTAFSATVGQTSVVALSPVEVATVILFRIGNNGAID